MNVCTIIAKNYAPFARVLARSFLEHHPDGRCFALVIDDVEGYIDPALEPFELVTPADLAIEDFDRMAALYNVLELSTAVKPWLLEYLLGARGCPTIVYLDPDIQVLESLGEIEALLEEHKLVVTPHLTDPMPRDGRKPSETDILIAGAYNLGFIGLRAGPDTDHLLEWWAERLKTDCVVAPELGYFVDQRWMDFAPGLLPSFHILRDRGYNVAYWNLPSRPVTRRGGRYFAAARPIRFFHYSGFDPTIPTKLSKHQNRIELFEHPALASLCQDYAARLLDAGYIETRDWPYSYAELPGGIALDGVVRELYRKSEESGALAGNVFSPEGAREFVSWLNEPAESAAGAGVTRYLEGLRDHRSDLRAVFPELDGAGGRRFVIWAQSIGRSEVPIPPLLVPGADSDGAEGPTRLGVNVAGYFSSILGVGEIARQVVGALEGLGVAVAPVGLQAARSRGEDGAGAGSGETPEPIHPINLICVNADVLPAFAADAGPEFFAGRRSIGFWWWEVSRFPERWLGSFDHLDEVWVGSAHVAGALRPVSPIPVVEMPVPVTMPSVALRERATLGLPEGFLFLFVFDYNSVFERKNPLAAIEAFRTAFEPGSGPSLVLKCINQEHDSRNHERLLAAAAEHADVHVIDRYVPRAEKDAMMAACDCYLSLHRSEGFGITIAEAMLLAKPAIATGYSGNLAFMSAENSHLVDFRLVPIGEGAPPYPPEGEWAEPDVAHAARLMREVVDAPEAARELGRVAQAHIRERHGPQAAGRVMVERLEKVAPSPPRPRPAASMPPVADTERVAERIRTGPPPPAPARFGAARDSLRRAVLRVMKPFTVHERLVDLELLRAIHQLDEGVRGLAAAHADTRTSLDQVIAEQRAQPYMARPLFGPSEHPVAGIVTGYGTQPDGRELVPEEERYREFEELFRGSESFIRARQRGYLELIAEREPVLDVGCGRGELLDLLRERGLAYAGVDIDPGMVARCRAKGHEAVERASATEHLGGLRDASLGAIFSAQVIEHLSYEELVRLFELSLSKLGPGGLLIVETVNPHSAQALKTFWVDLTHKHPVFPEVALALARTTGFESAFVFHPNGTGSAEADRFREGEYALVATRGG